MAGTIRTERAKLADLFTTVVGRFPPVAGYTLDAGTCYEVKVMVGETDLLEGKGTYVFAPRAILDLEVDYRE